MQNETNLPLSGTPDSVSAFSSAAAASIGREVSTIEAESGRGRSAVEGVGSVGIVLLAGAVAWGGGSEMGEGGDMVVFFGLGIKRV